MALAVSVSLPVIGTFFVILAVVWGDRKNMDEDQIKVAEFDVKPGAGRQYYEDKWVSQLTFHCSFKMYPNPHLFTFTCSSIL